MILDQNITSYWRLIKPEKVARTGRAVGNTMEEVNARDHDQARTRSVRG
jgi:hypothetical protein